MGFLLLIGGGIIVLDQITKLLILRFFPLHTAKAIIPGLFNLVHVRNTGVAFSLFSGAHSSWRQAFLVGLTIIVVGIIVFVYGKVAQNDRWTRTAYTCIVGGALGNLIDRLRFGDVVDFLDFYIGSNHWPAFNVADSAITVGALMLLVTLIRGK